jgi:hypothetical protein
VLIPPRAGVRVFRCVGVEVLKIKFDPKTPSDERKRGATPMPAKGWQTPRHLNSGTVWSEAGVFLIKPLYVIKLT